MSSTEPGAARASVLFGLANPSTVGDIALLAASIARHRHAPAAALSVLHTGSLGAMAAPRVAELIDHADGLFTTARERVASSGVELLTELRLARSPADGILGAAKDLAAEWIVLGHPRQADGAAFDAIVEAVAGADVAHVIVASILGSIPACGRVLVPVTHPSHLADCAAVANALTSGGGDALVLDIVSSEASERDVRAAEEELDQVAREVMPNCQREVRRADSKVHAILEASKEAHMVLLRADTRKGLSRFFFGSLANEIAARAECTVLMLNTKETG